MDSIGEKIPHEEVQAMRACLSSEEYCRGGC